MCVLSPAMYKEQKCKQIQNMCKPNMQMHEHTPWTAPCNMLYLDIYVNIGADSLELNAHICFDLYVYVYVRKQAGTHALGVAAGEDLVLPLVRVGNKQRLCWFFCICICVCFVPRTHMGIQLVRSLPTQVHRACT